VIASGTFALTTPVNDNGNVQATGSNGAVVVYTPPTAVDAVSGQVAVSCVPASGSMFALGTTQIVCTATDSAANSCHADYSITVENSPCSGHGSVVCSTTGTVSLTKQSMEGNLVLYPGYVVSAGYGFTHGSVGTTVVVSNAVALLSVSCAANPTPSTVGTVLTLSLGDTTTFQIASSSVWYPSGDQQSPLVWQSGNFVMPNLCNGNAMYINAQSGAASFKATFRSTSAQTLNVRFHYREVSPKKTSGSWSATASVVPGPLCACQCSSGFSGTACQNSP